VGANRQTGSGTSTMGSGLRQQVAEQRQVPELWHNEIWFRYSWSSEQNFGSRTVYNGMVQAVCGSRTGGRFKELVQWDLVQVAR